jgi:Protein of unknown function (DUF3738)
MAETPSPPTIAGNAPPKLPTASKTENVNKRVFADTIQSPHAATFCARFSTAAGLLRYTPGPSDIALPPAAGPTIFLAVQEQLGLKLEPVEAPLTVIVIDQAERPR